MRQPGVVPLNFFDSSPCEAASLAVRTVDGCSDLQKSLASFVLRTARQPASRAEQTKSFQQNNNP